MANESLPAAPLGIQLGNLKYNANFPINSLLSYTLKYFFKSLVWINGSIILWLFEIDRHTEIHKHWLILNPGLALIQLWTTGPWLTIQNTPQEMVDILINTPHEIFKDKLMHNNTWDLFLEGKSFSIRIKTVSTTANTNSFTLECLGFAFP